MKKLSPEEFFEYYYRKFIKYPELSKDYIDFYGLYLSFKNRKKEEYNPDESFLKGIFKDIFRKIFGFFR